MALNVILCDASGLTWMNIAFHRQHKCAMIYPSQLILHVQQSYYPLWSTKFKQEAHWPHSSPEKTVQINKHMIIILLLTSKWRKNLLFTLWEVNGSSFEQTWIPFTKGCIVPNLVEIGPAVLEMKIFKFINVFSLFCNYLPLKKGWALHLNKLESSSPNEVLCHVWLKLAESFWKRFLNFVNVLSLFLIYLPLDIGWSPSFEQTWIPFTQGVWLKLAQWF